MDPQNGQNKSPQQPDVFYDLLQSSNPNIAPSIPRPESKSNTGSSFLESFDFSGVQPNYDFHSLHGVQLQPEIHPSESKDNVLVNRAQEVCLLTQMQFFSFCRISVSLDNKSL